MILVEIGFLQCILFVPFVVGVLTGKEIVELDDKSLLFERLQMARMYIDRNYEEYRDRPDLRSETEYRMTFYAKQSKQKGPQKKKKSKENN